jgi:pimeloyl-ACP methyl ester carboxylesterase
MRTLQFNARQADLKPGLLKVTREAVVSVFAEATPSGNILPLLSKIAAPTLLLRADTALGTTLDDVAWKQAKQYLPTQSQAVQLDGATHNIHCGTFDKFMQAVNDFHAR